MYIKFHTENPKTTKNISFEEILRRQAKFDIYGKKKPTKKLQEQKTKEIVEQLNIKWLVARSESFKYFYNNFKTLTD